MTARRAVFGWGLLIGLVFEPAGGPATAQTAAPKEEPPSPPAVRMLAGEDVRRVQELNQAIEDALQAGRWDEAIAKAEELVALRTQIQGAKHFETMDDVWRLEALRRVAPMPEEDRVAYRSPRHMQA